MGQNQQEGLKNWGECQGGQTANCTDKVESRMLLGATLNVECHWGATQVSLQLMQDMIGVTQNRFHFCMNSLGFLLFRLLLRPLEFQSWQTHGPELAQFGSPPLCLSYCFRRLWLRPRIIFSCLPSSLNMCATDLIRKTITELDVVGDPCVFLMTRFASTQVAPLLVRHAVGIRFNTQSHKLAEFCFGTCMSW